MFLSSFFLLALNHDLFEVNIVQCHLHVIFVMLQLKMLNSFCIICPSFGALLEMCLPPIIGVTIIDFQLTSVMLIFCPLSSHSSPNQTALCDYILLPFPSFFCVMYIFFCFCFSYFTIFFLFLRFVCLLLLNFVIRHKLFQYDHLVLLEQMLIKNII